MKTRTQPSDLLARIGSRQADKEAIAQEVAGNAAMLEQVFEGLGSREANVKYGCAKVLYLISAAEPTVLYPAFDRFVDLLNGMNKILQWEAIRILANLSTVDTKDKVDRLLPAYLSPIQGPTLITAANTIKGAATIALAKPHLTERIAGEIIKVEKAKYQTPECRNVALGQAIEAFDLIFGQIADQRPILSLVKRQQKNSRVATKRKADRFLKKHAGQSPSGGRALSKRTATRFWMAHFQSVCYSVHMVLDERCSPDYRSSQAGGAEE